MNHSKLIDKEIAAHSDWRGQTMAEVRRIIRETVPDVTEVKVTFINGAQLVDVDGVFNAELGGNKWRAIKLFQGDKVKAAGLKKLLLAAVALNATKGKGKARSAAAGGAGTGKRLR